MKQPRPHILIVEDNPAHREMLRKVLGDLDLDVDCRENGKEALAYLQDKQPSLIFLDMKMPVLDGLATLEEMKKHGIQIPTVAMTAFSDLDDAVQAMKLGAVDYLRKPTALNTLHSLIETYTQIDLQPEETRDLGIPPGYQFSSPLMLQVLGELKRIAQSEVSVLLHGETGTGKEVLAELLHHWSPRASGPLVPVNIAAIPETLLESELFGHARGAFTGADRERRGRVEEADGGSLFLDEIGELALALQPKLLRVLQTKSFSRLGEGKVRSSNFRLVSATHRDLEEGIREGWFRQDLYYRIAVITVEIPPLRERKEDILALAQKFLDRGSEGRKRLSTEAEELVLRYSWPGNIRELQNTMTRAFILAPGEVILPDSLPPTLTKDPPSSPSEDGGTILPLAELEKQAILNALAKTKGNRSEAARLLGISRRSLLYRLKDLRNEGLL
ncbi:MAG TPA: sigma-54-dependent Fis family transcriptional regulator [Planctomycetes bacterium]|nr:sigma-54-dependent Fis family transcriptional regulator [Planctomycetota bacterium]